MVWSYFPQELAKGSTLDIIRMLIGDTDGNDQLMQDEEIAFIAASEGLNAFRIAWRSAEAIAAKFARQSDKGLGPLRDSGSQKAKQYHDLACQLKRKYLRAAPVPFTNALSLSDKEAVEDDEDRVPTLFRREMFIIPGTEGAGLTEDQDVELPSG